MSLVLDVFNHLGIFVYQVAELIIVVFFHGDLHMAFCNLLCSIGKLRHGFLDDLNQKIGNGKSDNHRDQSKCYCENGSPHPVLLLSCRISNSHRSPCGYLTEYDIGQRQKDGNAKSQYQFCFHLHVFHHCHTSHSSFNLDDSKSEESSSYNSFSGSRSSFTVLPTFPMPYTYL